ncbi:cyclic nucleotide phosphodiesterase [soil metagenome]
MKTRFLLSPLLMLFSLASCRHDVVPLPPGTIKIAVISDIHYMDPSLLKNGAENGEAFQNYLNADPKLVQYSDGIFKETIKKLKSEQPDILLVAGDLTKDGEQVSHQSVVALLQQLKSAGTKVFVVPGNHDIQNPEARSYDGNTSSPTATISANSFSTLYSNFGYGNAIAKDPNSLSYVGQPYSDLWILAIDACKYYENVGDIAVVGGVIKPQTMQWIKDQMALAKAKGVRVLGLMHHNLIEHYSGQSQLDPGYVVDNFESSANDLMNAGLDVIFTGHYHANDVSSRESNGNVLYDVETASLVDPPLPIRYVTMKNRDLDITTDYVTKINTALPEGADLTTYSNIFFSAHLDGAFSYLLTQPPFDLSADDAGSVAPLFRNAYMAHFAGDEKISAEEQSNDDVIAQLSPTAGMALAALWTDLNPKDNTVHINLRAK